MGPWNLQAKIGVGVYTEKLHREPNQTGGSRGKEEVGEGLMDIYLRQ